MINYTNCLVFGGFVCTWMTTWAWATHAAVPILHSPLLHPKLIYFDSNWLVIWPPLYTAKIQYYNCNKQYQHTFLAALYRYQLPVTLYFNHDCYWVIIIGVLKLILGCSRYQLFKLATYFYRFYIWSQALVALGRTLFLQWRCLEGLYTKNNKHSKNVNRISSVTEMFCDNYYWQSYGHFIKHIYRLFL